MMRDDGMPGPIRRDTPWEPKTQQPPTPDTSAPPKGVVLGAGTDPGINTDLSQWGTHLPSPEMTPKVMQPVPSKAPPEPEPQTSTPKGTDTDAGPKPGAGSGGGERGPSPRANPPTIPERAPGTPVTSPVTEGQTFALPGERGFQPFQGSFFGRDLGSLLERRGGGMAENLRTMLGEAVRRGDLSRTVSPGLLGGGAGGGTVSAMGNSSLGDMLGPGGDENDFLRRIGSYGGGGYGY